MNYVCESMRALENDRKKAEANDEQRHMENELTKGSSRASGSQADDLQSVESRRNLERTIGWTNFVAQQADASRPLSPNVLINPHNNAIRDRSDTRFGAHPKTTPLFQPVAELFSRQLQDSSILRKPEIPNLIRVTEPQKQLPKTTIQQQRTLALQSREAKVPSPTLATDWCRAKTQQQWANLPNK